MTVEDLLAVKGVSDPQISPDGSLVVYVVTAARSGHPEEPAAVSGSFRPPAGSPSN